MEEGGNIRQASGSKKGNFFSKCQKLRSYQIVGIFKINSIGCIGIIKRLLTMISDFFKTLIGVKVVPSHCIRIVFEHDVPLFEMMAGMQEMILKYEELNMS